MSAPMDVAIIGCGFVADFYMEGLRLHPSLRVVAAMDIVPANADRFAAFWKLPVFYDFSELLAGARFDLVLNLTNPAAHFALTRDCLAAGKHVFSEKPLAMTLAEAESLVDQAREAGLLLGSAPCNHLGEAVQAIGQALKAGRIGVPKLAYAEMDDAFLALSPYAHWTSASGAPWPFRDEFEIGCTLEHAAYHITWLAYLFGPITRVFSFAALLHPGKPTLGGPEAADFSVACLTFESGMVARLTCSILAERDHSLRVVGDQGVLRAKDCWFYRTPVQYRRYLRIRRRFMLSPLRHRLKLTPTGPKAPSTGAGAVDFARGPAEMALALRENRPSCMPTDFVLHFTEVMLAIHHADPAGESAVITSRFAPLNSVRAPIL